TVVHVQRRRLACAEVPPFASRPAVRAVRRKQRTKILRLAASLVEAEKRRAAATTTTFQAEEHQHRVASGVVVEVAPVGISDLQRAVLSAAVAGVGEADASFRIRRREGEHAAWRHERLNFTRRELRPQAGAGGRIHESPRLSPRGVLRDDDDTRGCAQERENPTGTKEHASSPQLWSRGGRQTSGVLAMAPSGNLLEPVEPGE